MTNSPQNHSHSSPGDGGEHIKPESVSTGELCNIKTPPDGADLSPLIEPQAKILLRPGAVYELSSQITDSDVSDNFELVGQTFRDGDASPAVVAYTGPTGAGTAPINLSDGTTAKIGVSFRNFTLDAGGAEKGIVGFNIKHGCEFKRIWLTGTTTSHGMHFSDTFYADYGPRLIVRSPDIGGDGIRFDESEGAVNAVELTRPQVHFFDGGNRGLYLDGGIHVSNPTVERCAQEGIYTTGGKWVSIESPYLEGYGDSMTTPVGIKFESRGSVQGGTFSGLSGGKTIHVPSGVFANCGYILGGKFFNSPDYHIQVEDIGWQIGPLWASSAASVESIDAPDSLVRPGLINGTVNAPQIEASGGEVVVTDSAGNSTTIS